MKPPAPWRDRLGNRPTNPRAGNPGPTPGKPARAPSQRLGSKAHRRSLVHCSRAACAGRGLGTWRGWGGADNGPANREEIVSAGGLGLQGSEGCGLAPAPARGRVLPSGRRDRARTRPGWDPEVCVPRLSNAVLPTYVRVIASAHTTTAASMSRTRKRYLCFPTVPKEVVTDAGGRSKVSTATGYEQAAEAGE